MRPRSSGEEAAATFERRRLTPCLKPAFLASGVPATRLVFLRDQALRGSGDWNAGGTEGRNGARGDCQDCARVRSCACWGSGSGSSETGFDARLRGVFLPEGPASASGVRRFPRVRGRPVTRRAICLGVASVAAASAPFPSGRAIRRFGDGEHVVLNAEQGVDRRDAAFVVAVAARVGFGDEGGGQQMIARFADVLHLAGEP